MRLLVARSLAALFALTWFVFPGFGLIDLSVTRDPDWPVVLEAGWGVTMTVLVGGAFAAVAVAPRRSAPAAVTLLVVPATWCVAVVAGLEEPLLGYVGVLLVEAALVAALLPDRERLRPAARSVSVPLLVLAALGVVPGLLLAADLFAGSRRGAGIAIGDVTMGVDHYAVQGALALALPTLALLAAVRPRERRYLGVVVALCAGYVGVVSYAFPASWEALGAVPSALCVAWAAGIGLLSALRRLAEEPVVGASVEAPGNA